MSSVFEFQLDRMYAAIRDTIERDPERLQAKVLKSDRGILIDQDFRGGQRDDSLMNTAQTLISNVANFGEHLRKWAKERNRDPRKVDEAIRSSFELRVILDLADRERHPCPPRNGGKSGKSPTLRNVDRNLVLSGTSENSFSGMQIGADGTPRFVCDGDGDAHAVVMGDVVDSKGERIEDLQEIVAKAMEAWRRVMVDYEIARGIEPIV